MSSRTIAWLFTITIILFLLTNLFMFDNISKKTFFERVSSEMTITSKLRMGSSRLPRTIYTWKGDLSNVGADDDTGR
ncbi:hypothetical protein D5F53_33200 (plasmid) [Paenibacillus lautus]|uniref:Uncharacterized protein n=1 Tax=Paenibacillus lautus TaxID=1401 RepID=A0A385U0E1_PAELA|nr:hypothetical protein D5F53_33200 [Paenibacillus lautus]